MLFADLKAAFDIVNREKMIEKLKKSGFEENLVTIIAEIYSETISSVKIDGQEGEEFWTTCGVRQGCPLSPILFSVYMSDVEAHCAKGQTGGIVIGSKKSWTLSYADDLAIVAKTKQEMYSLLTRLEVYLSKKIWC